MIPTHSCMFVTYWESIRVIRRVSQLFRTYILLNPVCFCPFVNVFLIHQSLFVIHSGSFLCNTSVFMFVRVAFVMVRLTNISRTSREHHERARIATRLLWEHTEWTTNSVRIRTDTWISTNDSNSKIDSCQLYELPTKLRTMHESVQMICSRDFFLNE